MADGYISQIKTPDNKVYLLKDSEKGYKWNAVTQGQKWSRICLITPTVTTEGSSGILSISCTRGSVVCNATFLITTSHASKCFINALGTTNYSAVRIRGVVQSNGTAYIELYDTANSIASGTTQTWHCSYIPILSSTVTTYTAFTDGTTVPSGYTAVNDFTAPQGNNSAPVVSISRSGTTFTATRSNGSTFTFTQQDNNTTYSAGTGLTLDDTKFNHSNSVTAKTSYVDTATTASANGGKIKVTDIKYDAQGHVTGSQDRTIMLSQTTYSLSGLGGIGTISASGTAPLTLSGSKSGTTYTLTGSIADASASASGVVNTDAQTFGGTKTFNGGMHIYGSISMSGSTVTNMYSGGVYHAGHNSLVLHGDSAGISGIGFTSQKATDSGNAANINSPSDRAFIQYHAYGVTAAAEGNAPTLATSGELGTLVIGVGNDATDTIRLQAPSTAGILHQIGATAYPIPHTTNTNGTVGGATTPVYVDAGVIKEGTALKDLAYISKGSGSTKFLREDGTWQTALTSHQSLAAYAKLASPAFTGTPTAPTAANGTSTTQIATTEFVNNTLSYVNAMRFKGTLGTGGTITALPASHEAGDTYRVITAGTWAGKYCEVGTLIICVKDGTAAADADWTSVETNEDGAVIGPSSSTGNNIVTFSGNTGRIIQDSAKAFSTATPGSSSTDAQIPTAKAVWAAIDALDGNLNSTTPGAGKTLTAFSQTNGKVSATFGNISITESQISDLKSYLPLSGGTMSGHIFMGGSNASSSTANTTQLVFGTSTTQHIAVTSNDKAFILNPSTSSTTNQIVLYLNKKSKFPSGIEGDVTGDLTGNADTATSAGKWTTARTLTIGNKGQSVDGSGNVSWTLADIGAAPAVSGGYLPLSGGTMTGRLNANKGFTNLLTGTGTAGVNNNGTYTPVKWTFNTGMTAVDGDRFTVKIPNTSNADWGIFMSINNGTNYYPVVCNGSGRLTTHFPVNTYIDVVFESTGSAASVFPLAGGTARTTVSGGVWRVLNFYDTNNNDMGYYHRRIYPNLKAGGAIHPYSIIMQLPNGRWSSITTTAPNNPVSGTISPKDTGKAASTSGYMLGHVLLMSARATYADGNDIGTYNIWSAHSGLIDARYSFNLANSSGNGFTRYTPVYIVGTVTDGLFYLDTTKWWTQTLPTSDDGKVYIYIGDAYDWYRLTFTEEKPIYWYKNGAVQLYSGASSYALTSANLSAAPTIVSGGTATVNLAANTAYTLTVGGKSVIFKTPADGNTDTKVNVTATTAAISHNYILMTSTAPTATATGHTALGSTSLWINAVDKGKFELVLGNSTATTTAGGQFGQLALYSASTAGTYLKAADGTAWKTQTLQAKDGTIALTSDIPTNLNQLTNGPGYTTNTGTVTSVKLIQGAGITVSSSGTAITTTGERTISITGMDTTNGSTTQWLNKKGGWSTPTAAQVGALASSTVVTNVAISADTTTNKEYALVFGTTPSDGTTPTAAKTEGLQKNITKLYTNPSTGTLYSTKFCVDEHVILQYNTTDSSLEFVFA